MGVQPARADEAEVTNAPTSHVHVRGLGAPDPALEKLERAGLPRALEHFEESEHAEEAVRRVLERAALMPAERRHLFSLLFKRLPETARRMFREEGAQRAKIPDDDALARLVVALAREGRWGEVSPRGTWADPSVIDALGPSGQRYVELCERAGGNKPVMTVVIARIGGEDGVWLEVEKQMEMWGAYYDFHIVTGEIECEPSTLGLGAAQERSGGDAPAELLGQGEALRKVTVLPELSFKDAVNAEIERKLKEIRSAHIDLATGGNVHAPSSILDRIHAQANVIEKRLGAVLEASHRDGSSIIVAQNLQAIPMHKAAGLALHNLFSRPAEEGGLRFDGTYVLHHHDFISDRMPERYLPTVTFENVPWDRGGPDALTSSDLRNCGLLLEHLRYAYGLDLAAPGAKDAVLARWRADFAARARVNLALADDDKAKRFEAFLGWVIDHQGVLPIQRGAFASVPAEESAAVKAHVEWALSFGRMSTDPVLNTRMMTEVLDRAFPSRSYREGLQYHLWTINADSGRICQQVTGKESVYFPNMFKFPESWDALVARLDHPKVRATNDRIEQILTEHGVASEDLLLTSLVRIVPRKQLELSVDTLAALVKAHPERSFKLLMVGKSQDEGVEYEASLRERVAALGLEDRVVWLGAHVGNDSHRKTSERVELTPGEWTDYFRARRSVEIYPSKIEGWGNRLGELAAQGVATLVHPYAVLKNTILVDLERAGFESPFPLVEYLHPSVDGPAPVSPEAVEATHGMLVDANRYDACARRAFEAMRSCYSYEEVRRRMRGTVPVPEQPEAGD